MLELFELFDMKMIGIINIAAVRSMQLADVFCSTDNQRKAAMQFLSCYRQTLHGYGYTFTMPDFIRYCSLLIHPLFKDHHFKKKLQDRFSGMQPNVRKIQDRRKPLSVGVPYNLMNMVQSGALLRGDNDYHFRPTALLENTNMRSVEYVAGFNPNRNWRSNENQRL